MPIFKVVPNREANTLIPIIRKYVARNSDITTDSFRSYYQLRQFYNHRTVNHSRWYVDPVTGKHCYAILALGWMISVHCPKIYPLIFAGCNTNSIECEWKICKSKIRQKHGGCLKKLQMWLNAYMWHRWLGSQHPGGIFNQLLTDIADYYN